MRLNLIPCLNYTPELEICYLASCLVFWFNKFQKFTSKVISYYQYCFLHFSTKFAQIRLKLRSNKETRIHIVYDFLFEARLGIYNGERGAGNAERGAGAGK